MKTIDHLTPFPFVHSAGREETGSNKRKKERYGGTLQGKRIGGWVVPAADVQLDKGEVYFSFKYCLVHNAVSFFGYKPFLHP